MTEWREWDWPNEPKRSRRPRIKTVEILPPRQPERTVRIDVHRHRSGFCPQRLVCRYRLTSGDAICPAHGMRQMVRGALPKEVREGKPRHRRAEERANTAWRILIERCKHDPTTNSCLQSADSQNSKRGRPTILNGA
jgi:hypothetical protein